MFQGKRQALKRHRQLIKNISWLSGLQVADYLLPLLIVPYIVRVLGAELFGQATYAQNIIAYLTIIINYGFDYAATQDIALHRDDKKRVNRIFWTVIRFKLWMLLVAFGLLFVLSLTFDRVEADKKLYFYAMLINVGHVFFPTWYFQGKEEMPKLTIFNFISKLSIALLIFWWVKEATDYYYYILSLSIAYSLVGVGTFLYVIKTNHLSYTSENQSKVLGKGLPIFLNNAFNLLYSAGGLTLLGFMVSDTSLGLYAGVKRVVVAMAMLISMPMMMGLFPAVSRKFAENYQKGYLFFKKSLHIAMVFSFLCSLLLYLFSDGLVDVLLGEEFEEVKPIFRLFSVLPFLMITANMLTVQGLYGMQLQRFAPYVGGVVALLNLVLTYLLVLKIGIMGAAIGFVAAEVLEISLILFVLSRYRNKHLTI